MDFFNEFSLMTIATLGAFYLGEYLESVSVMIFYRIGEYFQEMAVNKAKNSIHALLDNREEHATVFRNDEWNEVSAKSIKPGELIRVKAGEQLPLDSVIESENGTFNSAAVTGESKPENKIKGEKIFAGSINLHHVTEFRVAAEFSDSLISRILKLVKEANNNKSHMQLFITRFAKWYTPAVVFMAVMVVAIPYFIESNYEFSRYFERGLIFLVLSCPCALVISIPLGYFGGIGLASRNGILFKGANFLDAFSRVTAFAFDKTGTLTEGKFMVRETVITNEPEMVKIVAALESNSTHPAAQAITGFAGKSEFIATNVHEIPGYGIVGEVNGIKVAAGNAKLIEDAPKNIPLQLGDSVVFTAINGKFSGFFIISDRLKKDVASTLNSLKKSGKKLYLFSGDRADVVDLFASNLPFDDACGALLPEDKLNKLAALEDTGERVAFVGDGINDSPVLARATIGIAMGANGSDAAIEAADVVIQDDSIEKLSTAMRISRLTRIVVWQNIIFTIGVKLAVLTLGATGMATLWEAVFADVGVALLAIANAWRLQFWR